MLSFEELQEAGEFETIFLRNWYNFLSYVVTNKKQYKFEFLVKKLDAKDEVSFQLFLLMIFKNNFYVSKFDFKEAPFSLITFSTYLLK